MSIFFFREKRGTGKLHVPKLVVSETLYFIFDS